MVFSSAPVYLDPHNWHHHQQQAQIHQHQQQSQQLSATTSTTHGGGSGDDNPNHQNAVHLPPPVPSQAVVGGGNSSSIRPGSMADQARQGKIPQPEPGLKCPRCESNNTKFCYFNNYSLTQPRHFCKMCRRYWTRGGALRNVPVGGGCRRNNKRSNKSGGGTSKAVGDQLQARTGLSHNSTSPISSNSNNTDLNNNIISHGNMLDNTSLAGQSNFQPRMTQFPLLSSLQGFNHHGQYGFITSNNLGLNVGGMVNTAQAELGFQIGSSATSGNSDYQWRPNHIPNNFLAALDPAQFPRRTSSASSSLYHFPIDHRSLDQHAANNLVPPRSSSFSQAIGQQLVRPASMSLKNSTDQKNNEATAVKAEEAAASQGGANSLSRSFLGISDNSQYWNADDDHNSTNTRWSDLSGINSSTARLL